MTKKKIKSTKAKKKKKENKYFFGALLIIGGLLVIGISATLLFGTAGQVSTGNSGQDSGIQNEITTKYGEQWRKLGITDWQYTNGDMMVFVDKQSWSSISIEDRKKRMDEVGDDFGEVISANGGDAKTAYVMFHDSASRNMMIGTYSGNGGAQIQQ
ncbi:MAG TPA: hypothetical protein ENI11_03430 [Actinobacteria bacterium]|nr:hypothetical protein [Actinomycetota bacterium]